METLTYQAEITNFTSYLFEEVIQLTRITEFGISWDDLINSKVEIPPQGARFDLAFEGKVVGEKINGSIKGIDYLEVRADGKFTLNIHAIIVTDDGETISVKEDGVSTPDPSGIAKLNLNMDFYTASEKYSWVNNIQVWSVGEVNMATGEVKVSGYSN
jgi:hypothetical protein